MSLSSNVTIDNRETTPTHGGDPLDSSIPTPKMEMTAPNQVRAGTSAPNIPSSRGTKTT